MTRVSIRSVSRDGRWRAGQHWAFTPVVVDIDEQLLALVRADAALAVTVLPAIVPAAKPAPMVVAVVAEAASGPSEPQEMLAVTLAPPAHPRRTRRS